MGKTIALLFFLVSNALAGSYTEHYRLYKPAKGDTDYVTPFANSMDTIDTNLYYLRVATTTLSVSTTSLKTEINNLHLSTATITTRLNNLDTSTTTITTNVIAIQNQLNTLPTTYVNVEGDTMTGQLTLSGSSLTVTGAGGIFATYGVVASSFSGDGSQLLKISSVAVNSIWTGAIIDDAVTDSKVVDTITLANITQITNRSHMNLFDIGSYSHAVIDSKLNSLAISTTTIAIDTTTLRAEAGILKSTQTWTGQNTFRNQIFVSSAISVTGVDNAIGLGTNTPLPYSLNIFRNYSLSPSIYFQTSGSGRTSDDGIRIFAEDLVGTDLKFVNQENGMFRFLVGYSQKLGIDSSTIYLSNSNVSIGESAPTHKLRVEGGILATSSITASAFYGDGSNLTGISGDNLGNHTATQNLNMAGFAINSAGDYNAQYLKIKSGDVYGTLETGFSIAVNTHNYTSYGIRIGSKKIYLDDVSDFRLQGGGDVRRASIRFGSESPIFYGDGIVGRVGLGVPNPSFYFDVNGVVRSTQMAVGSAMGLPSLTCPAGQTIGGVTVVGGIISEGSCIASGGGDAVLSATQTWTGQNTFANEVFISTIVPALEFPRWIKITKNYTDFSVAISTKDIEIYVLPAGGVIHGVKIKHSTSFSGGAISKYTISVGTAEDFTRYASAFNVFTPVSSTNFQLTENFISENHNATTSVRAYATSTGANLNVATQGSVDIWLLVSRAQ